MRNTLILSVLLGLVGCGGGDNPLEIPAKLRTLESCLPGNWEKASVVLEAVDLWKLQAQPAADPTGLTWNETASGAIDLTYVAGNCSLSMTISFHAPDGDPQDLDLDAATSLAEAIALGADQLRDLAAGNDPFMLGVWSVAAPTANGNGAITAVIGGTANQNELERLRTTTGTPAGGQPPIQASTISANDGCELTFRFDDLQTDTVVPQDYPIGVVNITVSGPDGSASGSITMNNTVTAVIRIDGVPGTYDLNLETGDISGP